MLLQRTLKAVSTYPHASEILAEEVVASFGVEITLAAEPGLKGVQGLEAIKLVPQHAGSKPMASKTENRRACDQTRERLINSQRLPLCPSNVWGR